jgi:hypothetical protein
LLRILDRKYLHEEVSWIATAWHVELQSAEIFHRFTGITLEHSETIGHENQAIEIEESL